METLEPVCSWHESMCASCHLRPYCKNTENLKEAFGLLQKKNGHIRNWTVRLPCFAQDELHYYRRCFLLFKEGPPKPFSLWPSFCFSSHSNGNTRFALDEEPMSHAPLPQTSDLLQKKNISGGLRFLTALAPRQHNYQLIDRSTAHVCNNLLSKF